MGDTQRGGQLREAGNNRVASWLGRRNAMEVINKVAEEVLVLRLDHSFQACVTEPSGFSRFEKS